MQEKRAPELSPKGGQDAAFPLAFGVGRQAAPGAWMGTTAHWQQFWGSALLVSTGMKRKQNQLK